VTDELSVRLRAAAAEVEFPAAPDLADRVVARLDRVPARPARRTPLAVVLVCVLAVSAAALGASERARTAVADLLDLVPGVEITRTTGLPAAVTLLASPAVFGDAVTLDEARARAGFALRLPAALPRPDGIYLDRAESGAAVTAVYGAEPGGAAVVFTQWHPSRLLFRKLLRSPDTFVTPVGVDSVEGLWIVGVDHEVFYVGVEAGRHFRAAPYLAGQALVWQRGAVTYRLEGGLSLEAALTLVRSLDG
jgi:hypothetical protein